MSAIPTLQGLASRSEVTLALRSIQEITAAALEAIVTQPGQTAPEAAEVLARCPAACR
jgi:hypothetical protein